MNVSKVHEVIGLLRRNLHEEEECYGDSHWRSIGRGTGLYTDESPLSQQDPLEARYKPAVGLAVLPSSRHN